MRKLFVSILLFGSVVSQGQTPEVFTHKDLMDAVMQHHPVAKQANLALAKAEAKEQKARGGFDPKIEFDNDVKAFDDKQYYRLTQGVVKVPTWFGVEVKGGYENNQGIFLNPENNVPNEGLWYAGLSLPIGEGLFIDERRAALRQAQLYVEASAAEQMLMLNQLTYEASTAYWNWFEAWNKKQVYQNAVNTTRQRINGLKIGVVSGDLPAIDTIEAGLQLQNLQVNLEGANMDEQKTRLYLSSFLWLDNGVPLVLGKNARPPVWENYQGTKVQTDSILSAIEFLPSSHPELQLYNYKLQGLDIERRMKVEKLKPDLNLNYYPISSAETGALENYTSNNYKFGVNFSMPILLRKERGELSLTKIAIQETNYMAEQKQLELINKSRAALAELQATERQLGVYTNAVDNYKVMLDAENEMFNLGESSIFMVNSRELKWVEAQLKLVELLGKNNRAVATLNYTLPDLDVWQNINPN